MRPQWAHPITTETKTRLEYESRKKCDVSNLRYLFCTH